MLKLIIFIIFVIISANSYQITCRSNLSYEYNKITLLQKHSGYQVYINNIPKSGFTCQDAQLNPKMTKELLICEKTSSNLKIVIYSTNTGSKDGFIIQANYNYKIPLSCSEVEY